ncbi:MAG: hypothetical protein IPK13_05650 [Deltaproteobacteria bacterium]|nr:hypothetical protein [Deltaproteobacteria bacterium]
MGQKSSQEVHGRRSARPADRITGARKQPRSNNKAGRRGAQTAQVGSSTGGTPKATLPKTSARVRAALAQAADALWSTDVTPHTLLHELHEVLLLRCLDVAKGNYAAAAELFGPSRQSVQQYANSDLRDDRWKPYKRNRRR